VTELIEDGSLNIDQGRASPKASAAYESVYAQARMLKLVQVEIQGSRLRMASFGRRSQT